MPQKYRVADHSQFHDFYKNMDDKTVNQTGKPIVVQGLHRLGSKQRHPLSKGMELYLHHEVGVGIIVRDNEDDPAVAELIGYPLHCQMAQNTLEAISGIKLERIVEKRPVNTS